MISLKKLISEQPPDQSKKQAPPKPPAGGEDTSKELKIERNNISLSCSANDFNHRNGAARVLPRALHQGPTAPLDKVRCKSGKTRSGSNAQWYPSPSQLGQAP